MHEEEAEVEGYEEDREGENDGAADYGREVVPDSWPKTKTISSDVILAWWCPRQRRAWSAEAFNVGIEGGELGAGAHEKHALGEYSCDPSPQPARVARRVRIGLLEG